MSKKKKYNPYAKYADMFRKPYKAKKIKKLKKAKSIRKNNVIKSIDPIESIESIENKVDNTLNTSTESANDKGYQTKVFKAKEHKRGRGRPHKYIKEEYHVEIITKHARFIGYCPKCHLGLCNRDYSLNKKGNFTCPACGLEDRLKTLKEKLDIDRPKSKKEYLATVNSMIFSDYHNNSSTKLPKVEETIDTAPVKDDEEDLLAGGIMGGIHD